MDDVECHDIDDAVLVCDSASNAVPIKEEKEEELYKRNSDTTVFNSTITDNNNNNFDDWKERKKLVLTWLFSADGKICNVIFQRRKNSEVLYVISTGIIMYWTRMNYYQDKATRSIVVHYLA